MLLSLDIETKRADHIKEADKKATDALIPHKNTITCIGTYSEEDGPVVFRGQYMIRDLQEYLVSIKDLELIGHEFKFDIKNLHFHGMDGFWLIKHWIGDSKLMAYVSTDKISERWLKTYEVQRKVENKKLPKGYSHRRAMQHSLKTLAPYFLKVEPFWEDPTDHDNDEYVIKDVMYTHGLFKHFEQNMPKSEFDFYQDNQLRWTKDILRAELVGIRVDLKKAKIKQRESEGQVKKLLAKMKKQWLAPLKNYQQAMIDNENDRIDAMCITAIIRLKDKTKKEVTIARHEIKKIKVRDNLQEKGELEFNFNSPKQLSWLLRDELGYDIHNFTDEESTGKDVLANLASKHKDVKVLLDYRKHKKLCSTYYPSYEEFAVNGRIHCSFNPSTTRTGRLSSSWPNLQNQPKITRDIFIADRGCKLITRDLGAIEPRLIAYFSEDPVLCKALINGEDFHGIVAKVIFPHIKCASEDVKGRYPVERDVAKTAGLSVLYGSGKRRVKTIMYTAGFNKYTEDQCAAIVKRIRAKFKGVWSFKKQLDSMLEGGEVIENFFGRPIYYSSSQDVYMKGFNSLIQGSASDMVLDSISRFNVNFMEQDLTSEVVCQVHDEIVVNCSNDCVDDVDRMMDRIMTSYNLPTKFGNIKLITEGTIGDVWTK